MLGIRQVGEEEWPFSAADRFRVGWEQFTGCFSRLTNVGFCVFWLGWRQAELSVCSHIPTWLEAGWCCPGSRAGDSPCVTVATVSPFLAGLGEAQGAAGGWQGSLSWAQPWAQPGVSQQHITNHPCLFQGVLACSALENAITWWRRAWGLLLLLQRGVWAGFPSLLPH